ncbi:hypothetical protein HELRODRAFT_176046 [Helobdella robusta]|uniref:BED-type domain-containing protein n=1 Tax=Helobdella robusta TaxID=6412 RepID=T1FA29_HELRO|nr:hypothetical protein HELRODRAFT_176046 [Helobdella robusta]ESO00209.1 hypothetical protein HELRODRAFT_176046 [Helobdella robusta]
MSSIRKYFDEVDKNFFCKTCSKKFSVQKTGTTTHLWTHLEKSHPNIHATAKEEVEKVKAEKQVCAPSTSSALKRKLEESNMKISTFFVKTLDSSTKKKYDKAVLNFILADGRPFESAAGIGFKNLCSVFTKGSYNPPHPTTLSRRLDDMVNILHEQFEANLRSDMATSKPSITFDHWKADNQTNYLVSTLHFISESDWTLKSRCLSVVNLENLNSDHTSSATEGIIRGE